MDDLLNLFPASEREYPRSFTSEPHRLVMYEDPDDGFGWEVFHPDSCERDEEQLDRGIRFLSFDCDVSWHIDAAGLNDSHVHAFDEFASDLYKDRVRLLPGVYTMWVETNLYRDYENIFGGLDADCDVIVEPQKAIEARPA